MEVTRKPFQGVFNIIRFNWHFYVFALLSLFVLGIISKYSPPGWLVYFWLAIAMAALTLVISLIVSYYVYDLSNLYQLPWLQQEGQVKKIKILNINAGFDETTNILQQKFQNSDITICDFYDPKKHTEVSIQRARKAYPPPPNTVPVQTNQLPFADNTFDNTFAILSAHEIRDEQERIQFFQELRRVTKAPGNIYVTEHLRDFNNFLAYTIGFLHFHSYDSWLKTFEEAELKIRKEVKTTPFITTFILEVF